MNINVNAKNIKREGNNLVIEITPEIEALLRASQRLLSELAPGDVFADWDGTEYIVCEHFGNGTTGVVTKDTLGLSMSFSDHDNNWRYSERQRYLNEKYFVEKLKGKFGENNIVPHDVDLLSMDGYDDYGIDIASVSDLTFDRYRKYHRHIGNCETEYTLSTPRSVFSGYGALDIQYITSDGDIYADEYSGGYDFRPFFILKSSVIVCPVSSGI